MSGGSAAGLPLEPALRETIEPLLLRRRQAAGRPERTLSDLTFSNLLLFRDAHDWRWQPGELPCIAGHAYDGTRLLMPLFDLADVSHQALRQRLAGHDAYGPLADAEVARLPQTQVRLQSPPDDADYLYAADTFRHYRGTLGQKKANLVRQLLGAHRVVAAPYHVALAPAAEQVLDSWLRDKAKAAGETDDGPCRQALRDASALGLDGALYRVDGQPAGFVLAETLAPGVAVMRFAKALDAAKGLYQHMFQHHCQARPQLHWLNFEQDLGLPNFRQTKQSYGPDRLLAKHRVVPR